MCGGSGEVSTPGAMPKAWRPAAAPDLTDSAVLASRRAALRSLAAKRGLQSTFLSGPGPDASAASGYGEPPAGSGTPGGD